MTGLLADVVASRQLQPEPVATDALVALLGRSAAGRNAMATLLTEMVPRARVSELTFAAQLLGDHEGRPDIVGSDSQGARLVLEAKFDAELTRIQVTQAYAQLLSPAASGALVFLVPQDRLAALWPELLAGPGGQMLLVDVDPLHRDLPFVVADLDNGHTLGAISWEALLARLRQAMEAAKEHDNLADLAQIEGLVAWRSRTGWTPLLPDDLPERTGRQLFELIKATLQAANGVSAAPLSSGSGDHGTGRYLKSPGGRVVWVGVWFSYWSQFGLTPVWAQVKALPDQPIDLILEKLHGLKPSAIPRIPNKDVLIPLPVQRGVEIGQVIKGLQDRLIEIFARIDQLGSVEEERGSGEDGEQADPMDASLSSETQQ